MHCFDNCSLNCTVLHFKCRGNCHRLRAGSDRDIIMIHHMIWYYIFSYHIISYYVISYHTISYLIIPYHIFIISYHMTWHNTISYHIISWYIMIHYIILYCLSSYPVVSCLNIMAVIDYYNSLHLSTSYQVKETFLECQERIAPNAHTGDRDVPSTRSFLLCSDLQSYASSFPCFLFIDSHQVPHLE